MNRRRLRYLLSMLAAMVILLAACGDDNSSTTASSNQSGGSSEGAQGGDCIGQTGCVPANQPDVNKDGKVKIGILSPGDTNDHGYYESFVVTARDFADKEGWDLVIVDKINPAQAAEQARNICRQSVDMVAIAASELKDAIPVAQEDVCKGTVWYVAGGQGVEQNPYFVQTSDNPADSQYATGVAAGEYMKKNNVTKAGFITGPELDFAKTAFNAFAAGIKSVVSSAEVLSAYTGDFNDSGKGVTAANSQLDQGVGILYPYLGGATDAVADAGKAKNVPSITPGTDRCSEDKFAVSSIFSPGDFFYGSLVDFKDGKLKLGETRIFKIGVDDVPTVKVCDSVDGHADMQKAVDDVIKKIASGEINPTDLAKAQN